MLTLTPNSKSSGIRRIAMVEQSARMGLPVESVALLVAACEQSRQERLAREQSYDDAYATYLG